MKTDEYQAEVNALYEAIDSLSPEFEDYILDKCDAAALNWLRVYGIPETPNDVYRIFYVLYSGIPANLIKDGKVTPNEGVLATEDVRAERKAKRASQQQSLFDISSLLSEDGAPVSPGQYL